MKMGLLFALALLTVFSLGFWAGLNRQAKDAHLVAYGQTKAAENAHIAAIVKKAKLQQASERSQQAQKRADQARESLRALTHFDTEILTPLDINNERQAMLALITAQDLEIQALKLERITLRDALETREQAYAELQKEIRGKELACDARLSAERASKWKWALVGVNLGALGSLLLK